MKTITILSGKGGVGKSSFAASLSIVLAEKYKIVAVDCDVDAPNLGLLFGIKKFKNLKRISTNYKAFINEKIVKCKNKNKLSDICAFHAITIEEGIPAINKFLCEGCGACKLLCPEGIELRKVKNAKILETSTKYGFYLVSGQLEIGESGSGKIVEVIKEKAKRIGEKTKADFIVIDSSAGIGCPVIASVRESDFVVGITEPTPSGLNDLRRALSVVEHFKIPSGLVINKFDMNKTFTKKIERFAKEKNISILGKIPYDIRFVEALVNLTPLILYAKEYQNLFNKIKDNILSLL